MCSPIDAWHFPLICDCDGRHCRARQVFHWLVADRVEYLETTPAESRLQHVRIVLFMALLLVALPRRRRCRSRRRGDDCISASPSSVQTCVRL